MTTVGHYRDLLKARGHGAMASMAMAMGVLVMFEVGMHPGLLERRWWLACSLMWAVDVAFAMWVWRKALPEELAK